MAAAWWDVLGAPFRASSQLTAMVMANHPEAVALFFALSACHAPLVLLPPEPRGWRTRPALPPATRVTAAAPALAGWKCRGGGGAWARRDGLDPPPRGRGRCRGPAPLLDLPGTRVLHVGLHRSAPAGVPADLELDRGVHGADGSGRIPSPGRRDRAPAARSLLRDEQLSDGGDGARPSAWPARAVRAQCAPGAVRLRRVRVLGRGVR